MGHRPCITRPVAAGQIGSKADEHTVVEAFEPKPRTDGLSSKILIDL